MGDEEEVDKDEAGTDNSIVLKTEVDSVACESATMLLVAIAVISLLLLLLLRCSPDVQKNNGDR